MKLPKLKITNIDILGFSPKSQKWLQNRPFVAPAACYGLAAGLNLAHGINFENIFTQAFAVTWLAQTGCNIIQGVKNIQDPKAEISSWGKATTKLGMGGGSFLFLAAIADQSYAGIAMGARAIFNFSGNYLMDLGINNTKSGDAFGIAKKLVEHYNKFSEKNGLTYSHFCTKAARGVFYCSIGTTVLDAFLHNDLKVLGTAALSAIGTYYIANIGKNINAENTKTR